MDSQSAFGPDFTWGVATAAYQIEGAAQEDGRLPSIWDTFSHVPGTIDNGDTGDVACDHYHHLPEDLGLLGKLGVDAYRFSVAWPRVIPTGSGPVNPKGIAFYDRLVDGLMEAGIRPFVTLYHWDLPQGLQDLGGWPERDTAYRFAEYAAVVAGALGDRVTDWTTLNEPLCSSWLGHLEGSMAPGVTDLTAAVRTSYHLHLGHGLATQAIRASAQRTPSIGIVNNLSPCEPATDSDEDRAAAERADGHINRWWLDPIAGRGYPEDMVKLYGVDLPIQEGDLETIAAPLDYHGVNYYFRQIIADDPGGPAPHIRQVEVPGATTTAMGWEVHPEGLEQLLVRLTREYGAKQIFVTESGSAWNDVIDPAGVIDDRERVTHLEGHLAACARAVDQGVPLAGYFAWSLLDNFEWAYGYDKRFGLVHVDFDTQVRTVKASGHRYAELIRESKARSQP
jgi:beta-glucosidase